MAQNLKLICVLRPAPLVPGVPTKTRLESSIKKFKPHVIFRYWQIILISTWIIFNVAMASIPTLYIKMACKQHLDSICVLVGTRSTFCAGGPNQNTSRIQYKEV